MTPKKIGRPRNTPAQQLAAKQRMSDWHRAKYLSEHSDAKDCRALMANGPTRKERKRLAAHSAEGRQKIRVRSHNRRARLANAGGSFTFEQFKALGDRCLCCGRNEADLAYEGLMLVPDHVIPIALGGSNDISNIQPLCHSNKFGTNGGCNNAKGTKCTDYRGNYGQTTDANINLGNTGLVYPES